jgi:hypothetical protein
MARKRKTNYPPPKSAKPKGGVPVTPDVVEDRPSLARINLTAGAGKGGFAVGDRVRIESAGMYSGEQAVIERLSSGVIPSALVRTDSGGARQVRTIDLTKVTAEATKGDAAAE